MPKIRFRRSLVGLVCGSFCCMLVGCASVGPGSVQRDRIDYVEAISDSSKDQLLLNIVRLRYGDTPIFMDVSSVVSGYTLEGQTQAGWTGNYGNHTPSPTTTVGLGAMAQYSDKPTITYVPRSGKIFTESLIEPIPPAAIFSLINEGYAVDLIIPLTIRALNGVYNRTAAYSGRVQSDPAFYPLIEAWRRLQTSRRFSMHFERRGEDTLARVTLAPSTDPQVAQDVALVKKTLNLDSYKNELTITYGALQTRPDEVAILSRSMIQIMTVIASDMDVPAEHVSQGKTSANRVLGSNPPPLDLPLVRIHSGATRPSNVFSAVRYAHTGTWYWISSDDFTSKRNFSTILLLMSLAETGATAVAPMLTIPVQ